MQHVQVTLEAKLDQLLQHWNLERKLNFLQKKEVRVHMICEGFT